MGGKYLFHIWHYSWLTPTSMILARLEGFLCSAGVLIWVEHLRGKCSPHYTIFLAHHLHLLQAN